MKEDSEGRKDGKEMEDTEAMADDTSTGNEAEDSNTSCTTPSSTKCSSSTTPCTPRQPTSTGFFESEEPEEPDPGAEQDDRHSRYQFNMDLEQACIMLPMLFKS